MIDELNKKFFKTAKNMNIETDRKIRQLEYMLRLGVDINCLEKYNEKSLLMVALENEDYGLAEWFLANEKADVNLIDVEERTALFYVKDKEICQKIINRGAEVNHRAFGNRTPLMMNNGVEVAEVLIKNGALINARTKYKKWDLTENSYTYIEGGGNALMNAISNNDVKKIRLLLENGADINAKNDAGENCLINGLRAGLECDEEVVDWLEVQGLDIKDVDEKGNNALFYVRRNKKLANKLFEKGLDVWSKNICDDLAFMEAIRLADVGVVEAFIENGIDVNHIDKKYGVTFLIWAIRRGRMDVANCLINNGADVNKMGKESSALIEACQKQDSQMVKVLIEKGANVNACAKDGSNAIGVAVCYSDNEDVVKVLLENGANYKKKNNSGRSAWDLIMENFDKEKFAKISELIMDEEAKKTISLKGAVKS